MISHLAMRNAMIVPAWTEDRAMLGSNPSAAPGAETEAPGHRSVSRLTSNVFGISNNAINPQVQPPHMVV